jgi:DNA polymerase-1
MTTLLIDADGLAFRAAAAVQTTIQWDDEIITSHADLDQAKDAFHHQLDRIIDAAETDLGGVILCWSCKTRRYFRHDLWPDYKGNRKGTAPLALKPLREWANETFRSYEKPGLEADDVLGILATHPKLVPGEKVIVSHDKDLGQIPGLHLNPMAPHEGVYRISPEFGHRLLAYQALVGDATDNYPGLPGCGPVKAEKLLQNKKPSESYAVLLLAAYEKAKLTAADLAIQLNVARILQTHHYDFKEKRPILWQPTSTRS